MHSDYQSVKEQSGIIQIEFGTYIRNAKLSLFIVIYQIRSALLFYSLVKHSIDKFDKRMLLTKYTTQ